MATRRKKPAVDETDIQALAPAGWAPSVPKKKRVVRRPSAEVAIPLQPHPEVPIAPKLGVPSPRILPVNMKIEPVVLGVPEDKGIDQPWRPLMKDKDLSAPPKILQAPKKFPKPEVEDILEESERDARDFNPAHDFVRPPVRAGLFRKVGIGFALVALAALVFIGYVTYAHAIVIVHPKPVQVKTDRVVAVAANPTDGEVGGQILEVTVAGERSGVPGVPALAAVAPTPAPVAVDANVVYGGTVTLHNQTSAPITLVPTTRLLTPDGVLFRMKDRVAIGASGTAKAAVYADKPGPTGAIGPSNFTIPGLPVDKQKVIFAKSDVAMTAGGQASDAPTPSASPTSPIVNAADISAIEKALRDELVAQASIELAKGETGTWSGKAYLVEIMSRFVNVAPGDRADTIIVRLTLRVREARYDRAKALTAAQADLQRGLTSDRELMNVQSSAADVVEEADPATGKASVLLTLTGDSTISIHSPLFDAEKLRGLGIGAVQAYFENIEGVNRVDVQFVPPWPRRMPDLKDHITFKIAP